VRLDEPAWWYRSPLAWQARLLQPLALAYGTASGYRMSHPPHHKARVPVICVGNFTVGGTGKTPLAIALAQMTRELGSEPVFLSRGYGGRLAGPVMVAPAHSAHETGDEPQLLAHAAPVAIARDRVAGAKLIETAATPRTTIIMDDGWQNPSLAKDFSAVVVDVHRLFGNGLCLPAGPLRAPLRQQVQSADAIILMGAAPDAVAEAAAAKLRALFRGPLLRAAITPAGETAWLSGRRIMAFAGIANPQRFFDLLAKLGAEVVLSRAFPDHHAFGEGDAHALLREAAAAGAGAALVTTEKDFVRLDASHPEQARLKSLAKVLPITLTFGEADRHRLLALLAAAIAQKGPSASR